ncbi:hypothetical protein RFI_40379 [Reticulomyxa filosa]|uniref:Tubulin/FtsZ GTPase domain-containing protein n=1 Tax=Reticulomyxa filosa TaxID=46433 RepID=X6L7Z7_RETFI|nr:hypothetical protein RFI_40379 [Reticulomyxa filosa]|eukprot:ETN97151.1 hypothetical protein RFI_40379 [Reticulomyxa filosa]
MIAVLTIEVGQAGIQLGNAIFEQYCAEHAIDNGGKRKENAGKDDYFKVFFEETGSGQFVPYDTAVNCSIGKSFFRVTITHKKKYVDLEHNLIDDVKNGPFAAISQIEFLVYGKEDAANNFAVVIIQSVNKLLIKKKTKINFEIYYSPKLSTCVVEPYNALLETHWLLDHTEASLLLDNEAIYRICQK